VTVRQDVLRFLREPQQFIADPADAVIWTSGLDDFAKPSIEANGDRPLRPAQEAAWRGLADRRAGLVLGPPGTGKTHVLSWLIAGFRHIRLREGRPARVLVTAFTRNAIGNVLDAVAARQAAHAPAHAAPVYLGEPPASGLSAGVDVLDRKDAETLVAGIAGGDCVVGMTVWALHRLLTTTALPDGDGQTAPLFDLICIDEASQMVLGHGLMSLAALAPRGRIVVAGDDQQLPPIRAGRPVLIDGRELGGSLYAFLKSVGAPEFALDETFRLNAPLTAFPERNFYPGRYVSRSDRRLSLRPDWETGLDLLFRVALNPDLPLVVILHDGPTAATMNPFEARLSVGLAESLAARMAGEGAVPADLWSRRLAIVSPHRAQNAAIRASLPASIRDGAFVETVDRIQGKEREAVILSYCVADPEFALTEGEFIFSPERLNVAATRAESKLIVLVSRRLLDAVPSEQELLDKAEVLREFVFSCPQISETTVSDGTGRQVRVEIRGRGFHGADLDVDLTPDEPPAMVEAAMTPSAAGLLAAIRKLANESAHGNAALYAIRRAMALPAEPVADARLLHRLGWISLQERGRERRFLAAVPFAEPRTVHDPEEAVVRQRIDMAVREARSGRHAFYERVRDRFTWMDNSGRDVLLPVLRRLEEDGTIVFGTVNNGITIAMRRDEAPAAEEPLPALVELSNSDFALLNRLEDVEARRINFGVFDAWTSSVELATGAGVPADQAALALSRLAAQGHLMLADEGRVRSRMAEIARELRHVKQRFRSDDAALRPYLVRSLKVEIRDRTKPERTVSVADALTLPPGVATPSQEAALAGVVRMLEAVWGENAMLARFQTDGVAAVIAGWNGGHPTIAIAADTGAGKTEAAALPIIAAALADRMDGIQGTRAILAYPRVRLAANQAQRLAGYLARCAEDPHLPLLTLGLQVADVPQSFDGLAGRWLETWRPAGPNALTFPFFACPECATDLALRPGEGDAGADALTCAGCGWRYDGWIGSKRGLRETPPALFLPTTDSLHQWMHNPDYGRIFGDDPGHAPPRALLADEIHLYTHIHGAQVGLALRRLAHRAESAVADGPAMLAIGMSATIGDPALAWGRLIGRDDVRVIRPRPEDGRLNPRGREYFYFAQPEVESRGADIAGASTTIQALMCLAHGVRRRTGTDGGFRSLVFFDSIDKMRRLHSAYSDAEEGRELAAYRTSAYGDDATGAPQTECCGEPVGCDRFGDGECWWFAANDQRQRGARGRRSPGDPLRVAASPIYSGTGGDAEKLVKSSDVVFATSSLEVGYDDPDITLVYQHYAPVNLASFVQRKGRGGRGANDRPTTAVTLSIYSPRDAWWFRRPGEMVSPARYDAPLNPKNAFVVRGQAIAAMLDALSRRQRRTGDPRDLGDVASPPALAEAGKYVEAVVGTDVWDVLGVPNAAGLWDAATRGADLADCRTLPQIRDRLPWAPNLLFEATNLPVVTVAGPDVFGGEREDISLGLATFAPGNATRRYNPQIVHWTRPVQGRAPWLASDDYARAERQPLRNDPAAVLRELPVSVREGLAGVGSELCRPTTLTVERLGRMSGTTWFGEVGFDPGRTPALSGIDDGGVPVRHDSRGELSGFLLVEAQAGAAKPLPTDAIPAVSRVDMHEAGVSHGSDSGLRIARVYWGADAEVRFDDKDTAPETFSQTFVHPDTGNPLLHGYQVTAEGLRLHLDSARLDRAVADAVVRMESDEAERRWRSAQFTRYLIESRAKAAGVNAYEARRGADLLVAAAGDAELRPALIRLKRFWDPTRVAELLHHARERVLAQHPLMTANRVARTAEAISTDAFRDLLVRSLDDVADEGAFQGYLRSTVLHGLALRTRTWAALAGSGDETRMFAYVRLPIQFEADAEDVITIAEIGSHGDGTIRAVASRWSQAVAMWQDGYIGDCPNAEEDAAARRFWTMPERHGTWRSEDPRDPRVLARIAAALDLGGTGAAPLPASIVRILFGVESVGPDTFTLYDVASALEAVRGSLAKRMGRAPADWELASGAVADAVAGGQPELARLHLAYRALGGTEEESFHPDARLADQAFRLAAPLCHDGCRACVHQSSDLMGDSLVQSSTSRTLLQAYLGTRTG
jgi:hypothetical protein